MVVVVIEGGLDFELLLHDALVRITDEDDDGGGSPGVVVDSALARTQLIFLFLQCHGKKSEQLEFHQTQRNAHAEFKILSKWRIWRQPRRIIRASFGR